MLLENILLLSFLISLGINILMFFIAFANKTDKLTDISYVLSFIFLTWFLVWKNKNLDQIQLIIAIAISIWAIRLGTYLFIRILDMKKDKRFDGIRENFIKFAGFWILQAITVWIVMLPSIIVLGSKENPPMNAITILGLFIYLIGLSVETIADWQKFNFKKKKENRDKWINSGIWKYARHPNYFGEMLVWWGIFITCLNYLEGIEFLTIIGPIFISLMLRFVSGVPTIEKRYEEKFGDNKEYRKYKENTRLLIPFPKN